MAASVAWNSTYNEILCSFFILLAFHFFLRYIETARFRYYIFQLIVFILGFGSLEMNVIYPALAAGYAICRDREYLLKTIPLFAMSAAYTCMHFMIAPKHPRAHMRCISMRL